MDLLCFQLCILLHLLLPIDHRLNNFVQHELLVFSNVVIHGLSSCMVLSHDKLILDISFCMQHCQTTLRIPQWQPTQLVS